ncbi:F-box/LRR-repeat protein 15-like isoform X1 [Carya illinoinensis]|uniref:F-box/LRR-repeat protein 15-like isoform X1 n=1 Tax=Carya illinoinensis TaxID=32201 RepID=UPI001C720737|nr:F-box/LRR-repeat protein 15-like isoform X1 [Carya illinoinensis]
MKIWCCYLCFTREEDDIEEVGEEDKGEVMGDDVFGDKDNLEGRLRNEDPEMLGFAEKPNEQLRLFEDAVVAMRDGAAHWEGAARDGALFSSFRISRHSEGEASSASDGAAGAKSGVEDRDRDSYNKRFKVQSDFHEYNFSTAVTSKAGSSAISAERDYQISQGSSFSSKNQMFYHTVTMADGGDKNASKSRDGKDDEGDESGRLETEYLEVRMDLTDDLLHMVFSFLDHINLCQAARVCRQWREASAHEDFWRCLNFEDRNISIEQFEDMCRRYPNATEVNISGAPAIHLLVMKTVSSLRNLEVLTLGRGQLGDIFFHALADCYLLKRLNINDATLGNGIQEILINHDSLYHLQLTKCRVMRVSIRCPQLETMSLKRSNMAQAVLNCPLLRELDIGSCHKLSDAAIRSAAISCPQLESVDMSNCSCVSDETLREIALTCTNLHFLDASYCPNISLESVRLPMLTVLKLHSCEGITSASMAAISHSYMLEVLELDNCSLLTSVSLYLPHLQNIRLVHCRKFADLNLWSIMLSSIMVSNCPALHRITITSNSLQKLALQKQESLTTLALQCQTLQEVDLTDCESLTNSICDVFSDGGGCPMLKSLVLDNCESLTAVRFCSASLSSLSLVGCRAITALELACPYLEQVFLDGCDHLERASFCPVGLQSLNLGICPKLNALSIDAPCMALLELKGCGVLSETSINCPLLMSLDASFCSQLKDDCLSATSTSCPLIESLILMSCPSIGSVGLHSLSCLPHLTVLDLSYTFLLNLQPVFESCFQLKVLKLQACKYLDDSSLEPLYKEGALPALQELDLSYGTLCQSAIEELLAFCTHLTHVSLNGCVNMHDLNWGSSGGQLSVLPRIYTSSSMFSPKNIHKPIIQANRLLQNLNCVGCLNIRKVSILPAARCFHLSSLNLSLSANLKEVDLACFNLCFLNLSNCCSLEMLKLECPRLTSLFLQSCSIDGVAVEAAILKCSMLETLDVRFCPKVCSMSMGMLRAACPSLKRIFSSLSPL